MLQRITTGRHGGEFTHQIVSHKTIPAAAIP
jgi:hypothetical protein